MKNADMPAMPTTGIISDSDEVWGYQVADNNKFQFTGLTKREMFAMSAMKGLLSHSGINQYSETVSQMAVEYADSLLAELEVTHG